MERVYKEILDGRKKRQKEREAIARKEAEERAAIAAKEAEERANELAKELKEAEEKASKLTGKPKKLIWFEKDKNP